MDWNFAWLFPQGAAYCFVFFLHLALSWRGNRHAGPALLFASLLCESLALLSEYGMACQWIFHGEYGFLERTVPMLTAAFWILAALNLWALLLDFKQPRNG